MGIFDWFLKKTTNQPHVSLDEEDDIQPTDSQPIEGPPEFVRAVEMQRAYWTYDSSQQAHLQGRGVEQLTWPERLRLHHLNCMEVLQTRGKQAAVKEKCLSLAGRLLSDSSPYRPRSAMIWQGQMAPAENEREPDFQGVLLNPSLTHLGSLEIYRLDGSHQPERIDFVSFDDLAGAIFAPPNLLRGVRLSYDDLETEIVLMPMIYGATWMIGNQFDRTGRMTRFVAHVDSEALAAFGATGVGVGQQDLTVGTAEGHRLFGLSSVSEIAFPLDMSDPRFDDKARARGIDPDEVRRQIG